MTKRKAKAADHSVSAETERDQTGYCNPPQATQFKAGKSGNPRGRPKKKPTVSGVPHMSEERMKDIIQEEAYRTIPVRDGDKLVDIPIIQAVLRGLALTAAKGDAKAQRTFTDLVMSVEEGKKALHDEYLKTTMEYKAHAMREIERCEKLGIEPPEIIPHPDDIHIDMSTGRVEIRGPMTPEDKKVWDDIREQKQRFKKSIAKLKKLLAKDPDDKTVVENLATNQRILDKLTEMVPD